MTEMGRWRDIDKLLARPGNIISPGFEPSPQLRKEIGELARVFGGWAGGLGCELLKDLALSGFKNINIIDMDTIEVSNLNRQLLFRIEIGCGDYEILNNKVINSLNQSKF